MQFPLSISFCMVGNLILFMFDSLNWQHQLCKNPRPNPDIKTLFVDHSCGQPNGARAPSPANSPLLGSMPKPGGFPPLGAHGVSLSIIFGFGCFICTIVYNLFGTVV
jgi:hypothetical protein